MSNPSVLLPVQRGSVFTTSVFLPACSSRMPRAPTALCLPLQLMSVTFSMRLTCVTLFVCMLVSSTGFECASVVGPRYRGIYRYIPGSELLPLEYSLVGIWSVWLWLWWTQSILGLFPLELTTSSCEGVQRETVGISSRVSSEVSTFFPYKPWKNLKTLNNCLRC